MSALGPKADIACTAASVAGKASARLELERQRQSEGWRRAITADTPRTTLERSIGLLNGNDEDWGAGLEICPVPHLINDDGRIGWDEDFLFAVFVFQRQRPTVDGGADLLDICVRHRALRPENASGAAKVAARPIIPNECTSVVRNIVSSSLLIFEGSFRAHHLEPQRRVSVLSG
jgi:hypothetical protein